MNKNQIKKDVEVAAAVSPVVALAGIAAVAGLGYLAWTNRSKIQKFFKEQKLPDLDDALSQATDFVSEGATKIGNLLNVDSKPATNAIQSTAEKAHNIGDKLSAAKH